MGSTSAAFLFIMDDWVTRICKDCPWSIDHECRDGNGSCLNGEPPDQLPIRGGGFGSVLVGFKSDMILHILTRVGLVF